MSGGFSSGYRPSANVVTAAGSPSRTRWLETIAFAPDDYRAAHGFSTGLAPATRQAAFGALSEEMPYVDPARDLYDTGRPAQLPSFPNLGDGLASLSATVPNRSFQQRNDDTLFAQDIGGMLAGQAPRSTTPMDALSALFGDGRRPMLPLGGGR